MNRENASHGTTYDTAATPGQTSREHILDTDIRDEMQSSFLEYAYSVIYSRASPTPATA